MTSRSFWLAVLLVTMLPAVAVAQSADRGFLRGLGGITFGTETGGAIGGGFGFHLTPRIDAVAEVGWMQNVLPKTLQDDLDAVATLTSIIFGVPVSIDAKVPAVYGFGGARANVPASGRIKPFLEGGGGFAHITLNLDARAAGIDISNELEDEVGDTSETKFLLALGGGIAVGLTDRSGVDIAYRFVRIFTEDPAINVSEVYAGYKVGF